MLLLRKYTKNTPGFQWNYLFFQAQKSGERGERLIKTTTASWRTCKDSISHGWQGRCSSNRSGMSDLFHILWRPNAQATEQVVSLMLDGLQMIITPHGNGPHRCTELHSPTQDRISPKSTVINKEWRLWDRVMNVCKLFGTTVKQTHSTAQS